MSADRQERIAAFLLIAIVFIGVLQPELGYVPIWDGRVYANCAVEAASSGLSMDALRCAGHPSQGYIVFLAISQVLKFGDITALHVTNVLLGLLALASIRVVLAQVFPDAGKRQLDLVTLACAVHPVVLSTLLQTNVDFGVYVFFFAALAAQVSGRFGWMALAGVFLCFSKETGVLAYGLMIGLDVLFTALPGTGSIGERAKRLLPMWVTVIPIVLFGAHVIWWNSTHAVSAVWKHSWQKGTMDGFNFFDLSEPVFRSYAAGIFLLGFMWVLTLIIGADLLWGGVRMARRLPSRALPGAERSRLAYLSVLTVVLTYLLTSFRTWSNLRYFALIYPLLVILTFAALLRLGAGARLRVAALAVITALFLFAAFRSEDPVSRAVYGTFSIGQREMYRMSSITKEYDGPGRDEIVYNLQFTGFHHVQNALFRSLQPTDSTAFATARTSRWNIWSQLDLFSRQRTLHQSNVIVPRYWDEVDLLASPARPHDVWFLDFSYRTDHDNSLEQLTPLYREIAVSRTFARGHLLVAHHLELIAK